MSDGRRGDWDIPIFRPKMGGRPYESRSANGLTMRRAVFQRLARGLGGAPRARPGTASAARKRCDVRLSPGARRCIVKARYVPINRAGLAAARAHLAYIERDGVERDGSQGRMFGAEGDV